MINMIHNTIQEITIGVPNGMDGMETTDDLKILVKSVSDKLTEVLTLSKIETKASSRENRVEGGWRVTGCLVIPLSLTHRRLVNLLVSLVASHLKSGDFFIKGNYIFEEPDPVEVRRKKNPPKTAHLKGHTSVHEIAQHFHRPINEASKFLQICPTVLKKICRKAGLPRWPHRKLQSIDRELVKLRRLLDDKTLSQTKEQIQGLQGRISHLERERKLICFE
jgi:hypothetical protein